MHISEGVLQTDVLAAGAGLCAIGVAMGLKRLDYKRLPHVAILSAAVFVASLVSIPIGPVKAHLVLNGLLGLLLGWGSFPALFVALALQAMLFQFGGLTTLGINTLNMALPALACYLLLGGLVRNSGFRLPLLIGFLTGIISAGGSALLVAATLYTTSESFLAIAQLVVLANLPFILLEGLITATTVSFLRRVRPTLLGTA